MCRCDPGSHIASIHPAPTNAKPNCERSLQRDSLSTHGIRVNWRRWWTVSPIRALSTGLRRLGFQLLLNAATLSCSRTIQGDGHKCHPCSGGEIPAELLVGRAPGEKTPRHIACLVPAKIVALPIAELGPVVN